MRHLWPSAGAILLMTLATAGTAWAHGSAGHGGTNPGSAAPAPEQKAWGIAGDPRQVRRTITVTMRDTMRFAPDLIEVREGETVRLVVRNAGRVMHELVIGTREELQAHAALMVKFPNMAHDEPYMAHVSPGRQGSLVWTFNRPGDFEFACLVAGHFEAGMIGRIRVLPAAAGSSRAAATSAFPSSVQTPQGGPSS